MFRVLIDGQCSLCVHFVGFVNVYTECSFIVIKFLLKKLLSLYQFTMHTQNYACNFHSTISLYLEYGWTDNFQVCRQKCRLESWLLKTPTENLPKLPKRKCSLINCLQKSVPTSEIFNPKVVDKFYKIVYKSFLMNIKLAELVSRIFTLKLSRIDFIFLMHLENNLCSERKLNCSFQSC